MDKFRNYYEQLKEKKNLLKAAAIVIIMIAAVVFFALNGEKDEIQIDSPAENEASASSSKEQADEQEFYVDISGQVQNPGVYQVKAGTRLFEVIELAGGLKARADYDGFNQAEPVTDGEKIIIPERGGTGSQTASGRAEEKGLVNLNTADSAALQQIPGVGPVTAEKIISYRTENGRFAAKEDIKNVSGIGEKTYAKMKDKITV